MVDFSGFDELPSWFVALPDCGSAARLATMVRAWAPDEVRHPSGRPWLIGRWERSAVAVGGHGQTGIAVFGEHRMLSNQLCAAARQVRTVADLDRFAGSMVGSVHLVASVGGRVRIQGSITCLRRVFHAGFHGLTAAADRADVLARLLDKSIDVDRLALHLLGSSALYPLAGTPVWRGVDVLPNDHYLVLEGDGGNRSVKWWSPPEPTVPMSEGAPALRRALSAAVEARVKGRASVSCDLGGLDSTAVCSLAARLGAKVIAYTADGRDPMADDARWARRTVAGLGTVSSHSVEHHVIAGDRMPLAYDGFSDARDRFDEPCQAVVHRCRWLAIVRSAAASGSRVHLTGFGGDELLAGSPAHLHAMLRTQPGLALRRMRGFAAQRPWRYRHALRQVLDGHSYRTWLARASESLTAAAPDPQTPTLEWGVSPRLPPWATADAVDVVRWQLRAAARDIEPLASTRGQHVELEAMRSTSRMVRQLAQLSAGIAVTLAAPYYDDRVIEAGLAVRPRDRVTPWRYKPLIVEAMHGVVPHESLTRHTKDEGSYEVETGLREHRAKLLALCEDSRLARLGLIDADALRAVCSRPLPQSVPFDALFPTVACELWLRALDHATVPNCASDGSEGDGDGAQAP